MDTLTTEYGYDASFVEEVPNYLQCPVCQLVLRDPVMIIACGHNFCEPCFNRMETHASTMNQELRCPTDRGVITDRAQVCANQHLRRVVGSLVVRCSHSSDGCLWEGELSELPIHEQNCPQQVSNANETVDNSELAQMIENLQSRVKMWEDSFHAKEEEIGQLKDYVREKSELVDRLTVQVDHLTGVAEEKSELVDGLTVQVGHLTRVVEEKSELADGLAAQVGHLAGVVEEKSELVDGLAVQVGHLTGVVEEKSELIGTFRKDIDYLKKVVQERSDQVYQLVVKNSGMEEDLRVLQMETETHELKLMLLLKRCRKAEKHLKEVTDEGKDSAEKPNELLREGLESQTQELEENPNNDNGLVENAINALENKKIATTLKQYIGDPQHSTITDNNIVEFQYLSTVALKDALITRGMKAYYEVTFIGKLNDDWDALTWLGWASSKMKPSQKHEKEKYVGGCRHSWSWNPQNQRKYHKNRCEKWGTKVELNDDLHVIGVALDMDLGHMLFSCDGIWDAPMGVAFKNIKTNLQLFPSITAFNLKLQVNFGEREFKYPPPCTTYKIT